MTLGIALVSIVLAAAIVLLVTEKLPIDLTAIGIIVVLIVLGLLTPRESLAGFGHPAPITVGALFVVSRGLMRTGALDFLTSKLIAFVRGRTNWVLLLSLALAGVFSAFLNNTPVVVLFISVIMAVCCEFSLSPSKYLIPISFISILAGTTTLIGTSTNIIVSDLAVAGGCDPIGMFELASLGLPIALVGGVYLYLFSGRLLRAHKEPICELAHSDRQRYVSELRLRSDSALVGLAPEAIDEQCPGVELFQVIRGYAVLDADEPGLRFEVRDILLVKASARQIVTLLDRKLAVLPKGEDGTVAKPYDLRSLIVELVVPPSSELVGRRLDRVIRELDAHINVLGLKRRRLHYQQRQFASLRLSVGDILLVQTPSDHVDTLRAGGNLIVVDDVVRTIVNKRRAPLAMGLFLSMVLVATIGLVDILTASLTAAFLMMLTGCLSPRDAYRSVAIRVLLLIIGTIALGVALQKTGAAELYAEGMLGLFAGASPRVVLAVFIGLTSVASLFLSNNSTAVLLLPIALSAASSMGVDPRPFVIGICFGASACFATPLGYQTNLLVYGPGGYTFMDYVRVGLPLNVLVWVAASIGVPLIWDF